MAIWRLSFVVAYSRHFCCYTKKRIVVVTVTAPTSLGASTNTSPSPSASSGVSSSARASSNAVPNFCYALPLPLSNPALNARLAGMGVMCLPKHVTVDNAPVKKYLACRIAPHAFISPSYLYIQGLDPNSLSHGYKALEFVQKVRAELTPQGPDDVLISFSLRHLSVFNAMELQNFYAADILQRYEHVVDLKTALHTCYYFGVSELFRSLKLPQLQSLTKAATALGFKRNGSNVTNTGIGTDTGTDTSSATATATALGAGAVLNTPWSMQQRLEAAHFIYEQLLSFEPKIMAFLQSSTVARKQLVEKHIINNRPVVTIDEHGALGLFKICVASADLRIIKGIFLGGSEARLMTLNLDLAPLVAPSSILTPARQEELHFNLDEAKARLDKVNVFDLLPEDANGVITLNAIDMPFYERYLHEISPQEFKWWQQMSSHDLRMQQDMLELANGKTKFRQQLLCFLVENHPAVVFDGQHRIYEQYVSKLWQGRASAVEAELKLLYDSLEENDDMGAARLERIAQFFAQ